VTAIKMAEKSDSGIPTLFVTRQRVRKPFPQTPDAFARRHGLDGHLSPFDFSQFHSPRIEGQQLRLF
jgi:hypothetical protein